MPDTSHANYPDERSNGLEPISKHLMEREAAQWRATWGAEMDELAARRASEKQGASQK